MTRAADGADILIDAVWLSVDSVELSMTMGEEVSTVSRKIKDWTCVARSCMHVEL